MVIELLLVGLALAIQGRNAMLILPANQDIQANGVADVASKKTMHLYGSQGFTPQIAFDVDGGRQNGHQVLVPLTLGVMSKCPDAGICESVIDKALSSVSDLVALDTVYIGSLNKSSSPYGVTCKHGPSECDGNVQQLCVREHVKEQRDWWNFILCQNFDNVGRIGDLSLARKCANVIHYSWDDDFSACYTGKEGRRLLQESVARSHKYSITTSCSIYVNGRLVCVHDGGWKQCPSGHEPSDFVKVIKQEWDTLNGDDGK